MYVTKTYTEEKTFEELMLKIVQEYIDDQAKEYVVLKENKESI